MSPETPQIKKNSLNLVIIVALVLFLVVGGAVLTARKKSTATTPAESSSIPNGWVKYEAKQYGFKFAFPKDWKSPNVQQITNKGQTSYQIDLLSKKGTVVTMLDKTISTSSIKSALGGDKKTFLKYDSTSYSTAFIDPNTKSLAQINLLQEISLPKLGISAAFIEVMLNPSKDCTDRLANAQSAVCFTEDDYKNVSLFAKNIKSL